MVFAMLLPVFVISSGGAIDMNRVETARNEVQAALDAAVLAAFNDSTVPDQIRAQKFFESRTFGPDISVGSPNFKVSSNTIEGSVSFSYKTKFLTLATIKTIDGNAHSTASASREEGLTSVTATINSAKGAYDKEIYFFTKDKEGRLTSQTELLDYNYENPNKYYSPSIGTSKTIAIPNYQTYGYYMIVYEDVTYNGKHINPKTLWSTDRNADSFRHAVGDCAGSSGQTDSWEDGGSADYKDFVVTLRCTKGPNGPLQVRLVD